MIFSTYFCSYLRPTPFGCLYLEYGNGQDSINLVCSLFSISDGIGIDGLNEVVLPVSIFRKNSPDRCHLFHSELY